MDESFFRINLDKHVGFQHKDDAYVIFYGLIFASILDAAAFLKNVAPGKYTGKYYKGVRIIVDPVSKMCFHNMQWFDNWKSAKRAIKLFSKTSSSSRILGF